MGGILAMPQFLDYFGNPSAFLQGLMTVSLIAGEIVGSLLVGMFVSDRFGRRKAAFMSVIVYLIGQAILVAAQNRAMFFVGRVINGVGAGPMFQVVSLSVIRA
jgi:MFS family permease